MVETNDEMGRSLHHHLSKQLLEVCEMDQSKRNGTLFQDILPEAMFNHLGNSFARRSATIRAVGFCDTRARSSGPKTPFSLICSHLFNLFTAP